MQDRARLPDADRLFRTWFEQDSTARLLVDSDLQILECNEAADALLQASKNFGIADGKLHISDLQQRRTLQQQMQDRRSGGGCWPLLTADGRAHTVLQQQRFVFGDREIHGLTLEPLTEFNDNDVADLADTLGLTPTERRVMLPLLDGCSVREVADQLGRSVETVRSHVRNIYRKLGVNSRLDLLKVAGRCLR